MSWNFSPCCGNGSSVLPVGLVYVDLLTQLYGRRIQLAIALVKYKTRLQKPREGVCSAWLASLLPPKRLPIRIIPGTLLMPAQTSTPIIAIGPGTGIAPLRSIVQERITAKPTGSDNAIFVGCRYKERDFLFKAEWEQLADKSTTLSPGAEHEQPRELTEVMQLLKLHEPLVQLHVAASRDQPEKIYVQDVLRSHGSIVWDILGPRRGIAYLSG